jgi:hypothetical protein
VERYLWGMVMEELGEGIQIKGEATEFLSK